jgi:hypothetical protein
VVCDTSIDTSIDTLYIPDQHWKLPDLPSFRLLFLKLPKGVEVATRLSLVMVCLSTWHFGAFQHDLIFLPELCSGLLRELTIPFLTKQKFK